MVVVKGDINHEASLVWAGGLAAGVEADAMGSI